MYDSLIFDLDGTLWDATPMIQRTWNEVLKGYDNIREPIEIHELEACMGLELDEIARRLFPNEGEKLRTELITKCCELENEFLAKYGGTLFEKEEEVLAKLGKKYELFIVSNCQSGYIEAFYKGNGLKKYFKDHECAGNTGMCKGENIKLVIERNNLKSPIYIGDTVTDKQSADLAGIPFLFCAYGFGKVENYDLKAESFKKLGEIL